MNDDPKTYPPVSPYEPGAGPVILDHRARVQELLKPYMDMVPCSVGDFKKLLARVEELEKKCETFHKRIWELEYKTGG